MILMLILACQRDKDTGTARDTDPPIQWETGLAHDDSGAPDSADSGDSAAPVDVLAALRASPDGLVVHPGASWPLRVVGTQSDGAIEEVEGAWTSSDEAVITVADGRATAVAAGAASLTVQAGGLSDTLEVEVREDGLLTLTVIDATTGGPVPGVTLVIDEGDRVLDDDDDGVVSTTVDGGGPLAVTAYAKGYVPATILATISRELAVALRTEDSLEAVGATLTGAVDLSGVPEAGFGELIVGLASPAFQGQPLLVEPDALLSETRTVSVYGIDADLPQNLFVEGVAEDYVAPVQAGETAAWALAGPLPIADVTSGLDGAGDALALLQDHADSLVWGWADGGTLAEGDTVTADLAPALPLDATVAVEVGDLSLGFSGDEDALVLVGEVSGYGMLVSGFGVGSGTVAVRHADVSEDLIAVAVAQVDGLGSGEAMCATTGPVGAAGTVLPALPEVPDLGEFDAATRSFTLSTDARMRFVRVTITGGDGSQRDVYLDGGATSGVLPAAHIPFSYGDTSWALLALETDFETYEAFVASGRLDALTAADGARAASRVSRRY